MTVKFDGCDIVDGTILFVRMERFLLRVTDTLSKNASVFGVILRVVCKWKRLNILYYKNQVAWEIHTLALNKKTLLIFQQNQYLIAAVSLEHTLFSISCLTFSGVLTLKFKTYYNMDILCNAVGLLLYRLIHRVKCTRAFVYTPLRIPNMRTRQQTLFTEEYPKLSQS